MVNKVVKKEVKKGEKRWKNVKKVKKGGVRGEKR